MGDLPNLPEKEKDPVFQKLMSGFEKFKKDVYEKDSELFNSLKEGQTPEYLVFACADSRVCPSVVLGLKPGDAFTVRNISGMVPPYVEAKSSMLKKMQSKTTSAAASVGAALQYAVSLLKVKYIVVIGHSRCGGIKALVSTEKDRKIDTSFIDDWVKIGATAKAKVDPKKPLEAQCTDCEREAVNLSIANLKTYPFVKTALKDNALRLIGAHYDFVECKFDMWVDVS